MMPREEFNTPVKITWCLGCGNFGIWVALKNAFVEMGLRPDQIFSVYGIGCHGHMINYLKTYGFEGVHGRALPLATGAKIANKSLKTMAIVGDGDQLGEGGNHLIHAARRNPDITCVLHNNQLYSLTVGQPSPTSDKGVKTRLTPEGVFDQPFNPLALAIASGASFVARGFAGDVPQLTKILVEAINHQGFALVDILQPCVALNHLNTYSWFRERIYKLENHDAKNKVLAFEKSLEWGDRIPVGIFYREERLTLEEQLLPDKDAILAEQPLGLSIEKLLAEFR